MLESKHSFGGRAFDRYVFDFETDAGAGGDGAGAGDYDGVVADLTGGAGGAEAGAESTAATAAAEEAATAAAEAPSPAEETAPAWAPSEAEFRELQQQHAAVLRYLEAQAAAPAAAAAATDTEPPTMPHPLDEDYEERMAQYLDYVVSERDRVWEERFARIEQPARTFEQQQASARKDEIIASLDVDGFEKDKPNWREAGELLAVGLLDQVKAEMGLQPDETGYFPPSAQAAEVAMRRGAERLAAFAKEQREAGKQAYIAELEALKAGGTAALPGVTGGAIEGLDAADDYDEVLRRITA